MHVVHLFNTTRLLLVSAKVLKQSGYVHSNNFIIDKNYKCTFYHRRTTLQTQNICLTFVQRRPNVFDVGPTLYKCHTHILCLLGSSGWQHDQKTSGQQQSLSRIHISFCSIYLFDSKMDNVPYKSDGNFHRGIENGELQLTFHDMTV